MYTLASDSVEPGVNPLDGYIPSVPTGISLDFGSMDFRELQNRGGWALL